MPDWGIFEAQPEVLTGSLTRLVRSSRAAKVPETSVSLRKRVSRPVILDSGAKLPETFVQLR